MPYITINLLNLLLSFSKFLLLKTIITITRIMLEMWTFLILNLIIKASRDGLKDVYLKKKKKK